MPLPEEDPRRAITLRHVLNMSSGLYPVDSFGMEYVNGSGLAYWAGAGSAAAARQRGLIRQPGTYWDYENYDTLIAIYAMKRALGDERRYLEFPRRALLDRIGSLDGGLNAFVTVTGEQALKAAEQADAALHHSRTAVSVRHTSSPTERISASALPRCTGPSRSV